MVKIMKNIEIFKNAYYGNCGCSKCKKVLNGYCLTVGEDTDEEGYNWRAFCSECHKEVSKMTPSEIYSKYDVAPYFE